MRLVIQRVKKASVQVQNKVIAAIGEGALVLLGIEQSDTQDKALYLLDRFVNLRFFADTEGKMNHSILDKQHSALVVSQFTLYADCKSGRRPSFTGAAAPSLAKNLYEFFTQELKKKGIHTQTGEFGAHMQVELTNDGPVTLIIDSL